MPACYEDAKTKLIRKHTQALLDDPSDKICCSFGHCLSGPTLRSSFCPTGTAALDGLPCGGACMGRFGLSGQHPSR